MSDTELKKQYPPYKEQPKKGSHKGKLKIYRNCYPLLVDSMLSEDFYLMLTI